MQPGEEDAKSRDIYRNAVNVIPGGVSRNTVFHKPHPQYAASAKGCYVTDIDGTARLDFANNMASLIHGHAHPKVIEAVIEQIKRGTAYTLASEVEYKYADLLVNRIESIEKIRFVNSGTEAVMATIKAARAFTGKPKIAKAEGTYHGTYDFAEVSQFAGPENWGEIDHPNSVPLVRGTPQSILDEVVIFPYNDTERTLNILNNHAGEIAAVLIDPVPHRAGLAEGKEEFIEAIYQWTREHNALLIFDEVVTLRVQYGGAQQKYSVRPDLTAMGKIIGGGFPVGAFAGRSDIMQQLDPGQDPLPFSHSGTFSANPVTMTAGYETMKLFDKEAVENLNALAATAVRQVREAIAAAGVPMSVTGAGSMFRIHPKANPPQSYREAWQNKEEKKVISQLLDYLFYQEKIIMINTCTCMLSTVMTQKEIDRLSEALLNGFREVKPLMDKLSQ